VFELVARDKSLPKNQFERRIDPLLARFLSEILTNWFGGDVVPVVAEFPIKKATNNRSTNVDHLFAQRGSENVEPAWVFVELKTDRSSFRPQQLQTYLNAMARGMPALLDDIGLIASATQAKAKYTALVERFAPYDVVDLPIQLVMLAPTMTGKSVLPSSVIVHSFDELSSLRLERHGAEWTLFQKLVLPALA
jgi:hypothetical protein